MWVAAADARAAERTLATLGEGERCRAASLPPPRRGDYVRGRLAAREAIRLALRAPLPRGLEVLTGPRGEPVVRGAPRPVRVSVTHAGSAAAACAWTSAGVALGIDLERRRPTDVADSAYAFSRRERERLRGFDDPALAGLAGWTVKEAAFKALALAAHEGPEALEIVCLDPWARATVRATAGAPRLAHARVGRLRAAGAEYVLAVAWTVHVPQHW